MSKIFIICSGLSAAGYLSAEGHEVTVHEKKMRCRHGRSSENREQMLSSIDIIAVQEGQSKDKPHGE